jgi:hypothetical protein
MTVSLQISTARGSKKARTDAIFPSRTRYQPAVGIRAAAVTDTRRTLQEQMA